MSSKLEKLVSQAPFYTSDSRRIEKDAIFIALRGENSDGHDFAVQALKQGALAVVAQKQIDGVDPKKLLLVGNTQKAHQELASLFRQKSKATIVAVAGSNGKTSTKEFLFALCKRAGKSFATQASQNGVLGIPKTLEELRPQTELAIVEVGIDGPGEMLTHAQMTLPEICILTSIGEEHLNLLKNLEGVFKEERILADFTQSRGGKVFVPAADPYLGRLVDEKIAQGTPSCVEQIDPSLKSPEQWSPVQKQNLALAVVTALELGESIDSLEKRIQDLEIPDKRGTLKRNKERLLLLDHYNSNPSSLKASLEYAASLSKEHSKDLILLLGDMLDLGPREVEIHKTALFAINSTAPQKVFFVGSLWKQALENTPTNFEKEFFDSASDPKLLPQLPESCVFMAKASRGIALEQCLDRMQL